MRSPSVASRRFRTASSVGIVTAGWMIVAAAAAGCSASSPGGPKGGTGGAPGSGGGGGSPANDGGTDASVPRNDATSDGAAERNETAAFGIATRPAVQTCKPPASYDQPVDNLSATGCVDAADPRKPAPSVIPYDVNSPLWSDGADKQRFLALPDGAVIHVKNCAAEPDTCKPVTMGGTTFDDGHWVLPVGTVLVKHFLFAGKFIETRLFIRFPDIWYGFSYQWNAAQTDATLVPDYGVTADVINGRGASQSWYFPARNDCLECHNETVGRSVGLETRQLDRTLTYPSGVVANQIATLEHIGMFDGPVTRTTPLTDYTRDTSAAHLEARARSYMHANCAICHRPDGNYSAIDLRIGVELAKMNVCNMDPNKGDLGVTGSKRVFPASPEKSVMVLRMQAADKKSGRMPQLATSVLDTNGIDTISAWVAGITACP